MKELTWPEEFKMIYDKAIGLYQENNRDPAAYFTRKETSFLRSIGCSAQEVYDFVEDFCDEGEPSFLTVLLVTAVRREYFLWEQKGMPSGTTINTEDLPDKKAKAGGLSWLPRIIEKARAKLRGELPDDLMYSCGGDRAFLEEIDMHPADFLCLVWECEENNEEIIRRVTEWHQRERRNEGG